MRTIKEGQTIQVKVNGYDVGDRLLEDVIFHADLTLTKGKVKASKVRVEDSAKEYFSTLNQEKWLKEVKMYIEHNPDIILEETDWKLPESSLPSRPALRAITPVKLVNLRDIL